MTEATALFETVRLKTVMGTGNTHAHSLRQPRYFAQDAKQ